MIERFWSNVDGEVEAAFLQHVCHVDPAPTPTWKPRVWGSDIADNYRRFSFPVSYPEIMPNPEEPELCKAWKPREVLGERLQPVWDEAVARYWREREQVRQMKFRDEHLQKKGYPPLSWLLHQGAEKRKRAMALESAVGSGVDPAAKRRRVEEAVGTGSVTVAKEPRVQDTGDEDKIAEEEKVEDEDEDADGETDDEVYDDDQTGTQPKARRDSGGS